MRHRKAEARNGREAAQEPLRLAQRQLEDGPQAQGTQDRRVATTPALATYRAPVPQDRELWLILGDVA